MVVVVRVVVLIIVPRSCTVVHSYHPTPETLAGIDNPVGCLASSPHQNYLRGSMEGDYVSCLVLL